MDTQQVGAAGGPQPSPAHILGLTRPTAQSCWETCRGQLGMWVALGRSSNGEQLLGVAPYINTASGTPEVWDRSWGERKTQGE